MQGVKPFFGLGVSTMMLKPLPGPVRVVILPTNVNVLGLTDSKVMTVSVGWPGSDCTHCWLFEAACLLDTPSLATTFLCALDL